MRGGRQKGKVHATVNNANAFLDTDPASGEGICRLYQFGGCNKEPCDWAHVCGLCGDVTHLAPKCSQWKDKVGAQSQSTRAPKWVREQEREQKGKGKGDTLVNALDAETVY